MSFKDYYSDILKKELLHERFLSESPQYMKDDWEAGSQMLSSIAKLGIEKNWTFVKNFEFDGKNYELRKLKVAFNITFVLGYWGIEVDNIPKKQGHEDKKERFIVVFKILLSEKSRIGKFFNVLNLYQIHAVALNKELQYKKIGQTIYRFLINELNFSLLSDKKQYFGERKLWGNISKDLNLILDVVNLDKWEFVEQNIILIHGDLDKEYNKSYYSENTEKKNIRFILKKIS